MFPLVNGFAALWQSGDKIGPASSRATDAGHYGALWTDSPVSRRFAALKTARRRRDDKRRSANPASSKGRSSPPSPDISRITQPKALLFVATLCCAHIIGLILIFDPPAGLFNDQPLIDQDWGLHFHHLRSIDGFWQGDHRLWGYNPYFMAGYPSNTIQDLSSKFFELVALALSAVALSTVQWFKWSAFLSIASVPWLMFFAAGNFCRSDEAKPFTALSAALLGTIYWWNSLPREMFFYGMLGFPAAAYLSLWGVSLFYRICSDVKASLSVYFAAALFALIILPLHIQALIIVLPPLLALFLCQPKRVQLKFFLFALGAGGLSLLVNAPWLVPALAHRGDDMSRAIVEQLPLFADSSPFTFLFDYFGAQGFWTFRAPIFEKGYRLALLILGALGVRGIIQSGRRALGTLLAVAIVFLFALCYFGALMPFFKAWQPLRFKVPLDLFLAVGAAWSLSHWATESAATRSRWVPALLILGAIAALINLGLTESTGKLQLRARLAPQLNRIVEWIGRATPAEGRVLFEESGDETSFVYDGVYLSAFLPQLTGRQIIGGPINLYNDRHHFAEFHSGKLFGKTAQTLSERELTDYLRLYNIGAVVAFHPASLKLLQSIPGLVTADQRVGPAQLMKVNQPLNWFIQGEGKVNVGLNRLELSDLKGETIILKYHWIDGLRSDPAAVIEPVQLADDPIPFIKLIAPPAKLVLRVGS